MDERVEITKARPSLKLHSHQKVNWRVAGRLCFIAAITCFVLGTNITPLGYAFAERGKPLLLGWLGVSLIALSVACGVMTTTKASDSWAVKIVTGMIGLAVGSLLSAVLLSFIAGLATF